MSPKAWKASFSEFHRSYNPKFGQRFSFKSPDKPRHSSLSRDSSFIGVSSQSPYREDLSSQSSDLDSGLSHSEIHSSLAEEDTAAGTAVSESREDSNQVEEEKGMKEEESGPKPPAESDHKGDGEKAPSESSSELNNSCDSESLELQLSAADNGPLHIEETEDTAADLETPKPNGLENGEVSEFKDPSVAHKVCHLISTQLRDGDADLLCVFTIVFSHDSPVLQFFLLFFVSHLGRSCRKTGIPGCKNYNGLKYSNFNTRFVHFSCT